MTQFKGVQIRAAAVGMKDIKDSTRRFRVIATEVTAREHGSWDGTCD